MKIYLMHSRMCCERYVMSYFSMSSSILNPGVGQRNFSVLDHDLVGEKALRLPEVKGF